MCITNCLWNVAVTTVTNHQCNFPSYLGTLQKRGGCFDQCVLVTLVVLHDYNLSWYAKDMYRT